MPSAAQLGDSKYEFGSPSASTIGAASASTGIVVPLYENT